MRLIKTAIDFADYDNHQDSILLGDWCLKDLEDILGNFDKYNKVPYHWDDREKLYCDYQEILELYENILIDLSIELNKIHGVQYDTRYWRILVGPWLADFIQIVLDRYMMLRSAFKEHQSYELLAIAREKFSNVPNDMAEFYKVFATDDWNESIYVQLIESCWPQQVKIKRVKKTKKSLPHYFKSSFFKIYFWFTRNN